MSPDLENVRALAVHLYDRRIGIINRLAGDRQIFAFDEEYIEDPNRPTLSLSFKGQGNAVINKAHAFRGRVHPFFSNLLPEGHLRSYLATQAGVKPEREFFLLAALGADLPGAAVVTSIDEAGREPDASEPPRGTLAGSRPPGLRFSLAGVQLKFSAVMEATGGLTIPADGMGGSWIVKLPSARFASVPENEFVMLELARAVGIAVPPSRLISVDQIAGLPADTGTLDGHALAVERFDRGPGGERIHMEDFAQVFGLFPDDKYDKRSYANIAAVLSAEIGEEGVSEFLRRLVFTVLIGNGDMHLKNWSVLYPDQKKPMLSPAYDFVSTIPYLPDEELGLTFGRSRSLSSITRDQIRRFADTARLSVSPLWETVRETVDRTTSAWANLEARELLPADIRRQIALQIETAARGTER